MAADRGVAELLLGGDPAAHLVVGGAGALEPLQKPGHIGGRADQHHAPGTLGDESPEHEFPPAREQQGVQQPVEDQDRAREDRIAPEEVDRDDEDGLERTGDRQRGSRPLAPACGGVRVEPLRFLMVPRNAVVSGHREGEENTAGDQHCSRQDRP